MKIETAYSIIENVYGFDDESTPVGEAFAAVKAENARLRTALEQLADDKGAAYWTAKEAQDIARQALNAETNADEH